jgi:hypothetical protein
MRVINQFRTRGLLIEYSPRFPPIIFPIVNVTTRGLVIDYTHGFSPISFPIGLPVYERRENAEITP